MNLKRTRDVGLSTACSPGHISQPPLCLHVLRLSWGVAQLDLRTHAMTSFCGQKPSDLCRRKPLYHYRRLARQLLYLEYLIERHWKTNKIKPVTPSSPTEKVTRFKNLQDRYLSSVLDEPTIIGCPGCDDNSRLKRTAVSECGSNMQIIMSLHEKQTSTQLWVREQLCRAPLWRINSNDLKTHLISDHYYACV